MKGKRVSIDLTPHAVDELDRLRRLTGMTNADLFRNAMSLLRIYVDTRIEGKEFRILAPGSPADQVRLEMPIPVSTGIYGNEVAAK